MVTISFTEEEYKHLKVAFDSHFHVSARSYHKYDIKASDTMLVLANTLKKITDAGENQHD